MSQSSSPVLLAGATTPIGQALARRLLSRGHAVQVLTRAPEAPPLQALERHGAELVPQPEALEGRVALCRRASRLVLAPALLFTPPEELSALVPLIDAAATAAAHGGPEQLVLVSAASANEATGVPWLEESFRLEERVRASGLPFTVVRPALLMESLLAAPFLQRLADGHLELPLSPWRRVQWVAARDVAEAAARVLEDEPRFRFRSLDVAADSKSPTAVAALLAAACSRPCDVGLPAPERLLALDPEVRALFGWLEERGTRTDIDAVRATFPSLPVGSFEAWAASLDEGLLEIARSAQGTG